MKLKQPEFLILQSVNPDANRYRIYRIVITFNEVKNEYLVKCSWGRLGGKGTSKSYWVENEKSLTRFVQSLLMKRKRHEYGILERSKNFPKCKAVEQLPLTTSFDVQLKLFSN